MKRSPSRLLFISLCVSAGGLIKSSPSPPPPLPCGHHKLIRQLQDDPRLLIRLWSRRSVSCAYFSFFKQTAAWCWAFLISDNQSWSIRSTKKYGANCAGGTGILFNISESLFYTPLVLLCVCEVFNQFSWRPARDRLFLFGAKLKRKSPPMSQRPQFDPTRLNWQKYGAPIKNIPQRLNIHHRHLRVAYKRWIDFFRRDIWGLM